MEPFANAIAGNMQSGRAVESDMDDLINLMREFVDLIKSGGLQVVTDTGALVGAVAPRMGRELAYIDRMGER